MDVLPGFNVRPFPRSTIGAGVDVPLTSPRTFDDAVHALFTREF